MYFNYEIVIIYKAEKDHICSYEILKNEYNNYKFIEENTSLTSLFYYSSKLFYPFNLYRFIKHKKLRHFLSNFKYLLQSVLKSTNKPYVMFCTDDGYFYSKCDITADILKFIDNNPLQTNYKMFVGKNVKDYENKCRGLGDKYLSWNYYDIKNKGHWAHPFSVDATVYSKSAVSGITEKILYVNPNTFEGMTGGYCRQKRLFRTGISPVASCYFCLPVNIVQTVTSNYSGNIEPDFLKNKFLEGYRLTLPENINITSKYYLPDRIQLVKNNTVIEIETNFQ